VADDDDFILRCYQKAFSHSSQTSADAGFDSLSRELFGRSGDGSRRPVFDLVACKQGEEAVSQLTAALESDRPFDVAILDVRMPPGINGLEAGQRLRELDPDIPVVFVTGYSDVPKEELERKLPPPSRLHYFTKPLSFSDLADEVARIAQEVSAGEDT
jgi:CheY-like chemotaxis protein